MQEFDRFTLREYHEALAGKGATPGGGSAAALIGGLGAALVAMVANLTAGRKKFAAAEADMQHLLTEAAELQDTMLRLVSEDTVAFDGVMAAYALPKATDEEKAVRQQAVWAGYRDACQIPLKVATHSLEILRLAITAAEKGNPNAVSDAAVAGLAAHAALCAALLNVRINLKSLPADDWTEHTRAQVADLLKQGQSLHQEVQNITDSILDA